MIRSFKYIFRQYLLIVFAVACVVALLLLLDSSVKGSDSVSKEDEQYVTVIEEGMQTTENGAPKLVGKVSREKVNSVLLSQPIAGIPKPNAIPPKPLPKEDLATSPYASLIDDIDEYDRETFARLIYHESRGKGGEAVAEVVLNRMLNDQFPSTLQDVVYEENQFSPADILFTAKIKEPEAFDDCERIVEEVLDPNYRPTLPGYYLYFNSIEPGSEDYCWLGGNVFYGLPSDKDDYRS